MRPATACTDAALAPLEEVLLPFLSSSLWLPKSFPLVSQQNRPPVLPSLSVSKHPLTLFPLRESLQISESITY